jgi:hypothetical protein
MDRVRREVAQAFGEVFAMQMVAASAAGRD